MVKVKFIASAQRHAEEIVSGTTTVRNYLQDKNAMMGAKFSIGGTMLTETQLDMTFDQIVDAGLASNGATIMLYETIKTSNAA